MAEVSVWGNDSRKRLRQQIMVPFLWEERPGLPKRDWKPAPIPSPAPAPAPAPTPALAPAFPVKLVVSVPFKWEEKPGTPIRCFRQESSESNHQQDEPRYLPPPPGYFQRYDKNDGVSDGSDNEYEDWDSMSDSKFEAESTQTYLSFSSAQTLTANRLVPTAAISSAVPSEDTCLMEQIDGKTGTAALSESIGCVNNYATVDASLKGSTFLQHLFPLYQPKSSLLKKIKYPAQRTDEVFCTSEGRYKNLDHERNQSAVIRMPRTLGELIMLSRRRSCRRKEIQMRENMLPVREDFSEEKTPGCCIFGASSAGIAQLLGTKNLLPLKLKKNTSECLHSF